MANLRKFVLVKMNFQIYSKSLATIISNLPYTMPTSIKYYDKFSNFTLNELLFLIGNQLNGDSAGNYQYADKLLRFCEINLHNYKKKLNNKDNGSYEIELFHNLLISFFLNEYLICSDYRYFNIALKLRDITIRVIQLVIGESNKSELKYIRLINDSLMEKVLNDE